MTKKYIRPKYSDIVVRDMELTAANTQIGDLQLRIRELENLADKWSEEACKVGDQLAAEREVSDKLEKALREVIKLAQIPSSRRARLLTAVTALAEIEAIRSKGEQA